MSSIQPKDFKCFLFSNVGLFACKSWGCVCVCVLGGWGGEVRDKSILQRYYIAKLYTLQGPPDVLTRFN